jgi:hypothetical protein
LKMPGFANRPRASLSASTQNPAVSVFEVGGELARHIGHARRLPVAA